MDNNRNAVLVCLADLYSDCDFIGNKEVRYNIEISLNSLKDHFKITDKEIKEVQQHI